MPSIDDLARETARLRAENDMLKSLLQASGIALPVAAPNTDSFQQPGTSADIAITKRSPLSEKNQTLSVVVSRAS